MKLIKPIYKYICRECIVFSCCSELCDKVKNIDYKVLNKCLKRGDCPDCGRREINHIPTSRFTYTSVYTCNYCNHKFKKVDKYYSRF